MRFRLYRDVVHGQIRFKRDGSLSGDSEDAIAHLVPKIWETDVFQRLRSIRQNGLTNFVFAGMEHSRFSHSMGVFHLSRRIYDSIIQNSGLTVNDRERTLTAIAGLVHDIGHGPFSHSLEQAFPKFDHEEMSLRVLAEHESLSSILRDIDETFVDDLGPYIHKENRTTDLWTYRVISSQLDADRLDYMLRDSLHAGLQGHGFDLERLLDVISTQDNKIVCEHSSLPTIEAYLLSRLHLYEIVYFHKSVRASQCLLISILRRCRDLICDGNRKHLCLLPRPLIDFLVTLSTDAPLTVSNFARVGDHHLWAAFDEWAISSPDPILKDLCLRLVRRTPFRALPVPEAEKSSLQDVGLKSVSACAKILGLSEDDTKNYYFASDSPATIAYTAFDPNKKKPEEEIWMRSRLGELVPLGELDNNPVVAATKKPRTSHYFVCPTECVESVRPIIAGLSP